MVTKRSHWGGKDSHVMNQKILIKTLPFLFSLNVSFAQTAAERLEQGVQYLTVEGDPSAAILEFKEVVKEGARTNRAAAEARFRLAECFAALGNAKQRDYHLAKLREDFPADQKWVKKALTAFPERYHFATQPWQDDELWTFEAVMDGEVLPGQYVMALRQQVGGAWESCMVRSLGGAGLSRSVFSEDGMRSIYSRWFMDVSGGMILDGSIQGSDIKANTIPTFENDHIVQLLRALDQKIGTEQKTLVVMAYDTNVTIPFSLKVVSHEEVETKAGTFTCAKIETSLNQTFYISQEDDRKLVKIDFGTIQMDLLRVEKWQRDAPRALSSENLGVTYEIPGLVLHTPVVDSKDVYREQIWMSDFNGIHGLIEVNLRKNLMEEAGESSEAFAQFILASLEKSRKELEVEDERVSFKLDGVDAVGVYLKHNKGLKSVHEYHVFAVGEKLALSYSLTYDADGEEGATERTHQILDTFRWNQ